MNKSEMNELVIRYAETNEQKKALVEDVKEMGEEIREYLEDHETDRFEAMGWVATLSVRNGKKLNLDKVAAALGGEIPADFFEDTETTVLNVKPVKAAKGAGAKPKMAVVAA